MQTSIIVPGTITLFGDFGSLFSYPSIVISDFSQAVTVTVDLRTDSIIHLTIPQLKLQAVNLKTQQLPENLTYISKLLKLIITSFKSIPGLDISVSLKTDIQTPQTQYQIGVGLLKAIVNLGKLKLDKQQLLAPLIQINQNTVENVYQPDLAAMLYGQTIIFNPEDKKVSKLNNNHLSLLFIKLSDKSDILSLRKISSLFDKHPQELIDYKKYMMVLLGEATRIWPKQQSGSLGQLMIRNQKILQNMALIDDHIHKLCVQIHLAGADGAKISNYGQGIVALVPTGQEELICWKCRHQGIMVSVVEAKNSAKK